MNFKSHIGNILVRSFTGRRHSCRGLRKNDRILDWPPIQVLFQRFFGIGKVVRFVKHLFRSLLFAICYTARYRRIQLGWIPVWQHGWIQGRSGVAPHHIARASRCETNTRCGPTPEKDNQNRDVMDDLEHISQRYTILMERRRCGKSPKRKANRGELFQQLRYVYNLYNYFRTLRYFTS